MSVDTSKSRTIDVKELRHSLTAWIKDHPYETLIYVFKGLAFFHPALVTFPALVNFGLKVGGPVPGKHGGRKASR
jgi:hypothetical protein